MKWFVSLLLLFVVGAAFAQDKPDERPKPKYGRGCVLPSKEVLDARHAAARERHYGRMRALPKATAPSFDCRTLGYIPPVKDQGACGSCWLFSGTDTIEIAFMRAGQLAVTSGGLSEQYGMDCHTGWGGCNGGDEANVIAFGKSTGLPLTKDWNGIKGYNSPYAQRAQSCKSLSGVKMWKIEDWGYCHLDQGQGVASVQQIKDAIVAFGPVSVAVDASGFDSYSSGIMVGTGHNIDHAVMIVGWQDDASVKGGGYWIVRNQWSSQWGEQGYARIAYGSYDIGTEAIWVSVTQLPPPPPPPPGPTPIPGTNTGTVTVKIAGQADQVFQFNFPETTNGIMTLDQFKALQDELQKLQDIIKQSKTADAPCPQVQVLMKRVESLEKEVKTNKEVTNKNLSDLIDAIQASQKAVESLMKKESSSIRTIPRDDKMFGIIAKVPEEAIIVVDGFTTESKGSLRKFYSDPSISGRATRNVVVHYGGRTAKKDVVVVSGQDTFLDFTQSF